MGILIGIVLILAVAGYAVIRRSTKTVSYKRDIRPSQNAKRTPVNEVCPCRKPRCAYKGKDHPRQVSNYTWRRHPGKK